jgi:hypothetical protein
MNIFIALGIFFGQLIYNLSWTYCVRKVASGNKLAAALSGGFNTLLSSILVISFVENKLYVIPLTIGSVIGTYIAMVLDYKISNLHKTHLNL